MDEDFSFFLFPPTAPVEFVSAASGEEERAGSTDTADGFFITISDGAMAASSGGREKLCSFNRSLIDS